MTGEEIEEWRARSERLRGIGERTDPGADRDLIMFAAGSLLGLAHRAAELERSIRQYNGNAAAAILEVVQLRVEVQQHRATAEALRKLADELP